MPDVTTLLEQDHREVEQMFSNYLWSGDPSLAERICQELELHTEAEEQHVYPALTRSVPGGGEMEREATHEHDEVASMIDTVRRAGFAGDEVRQTMQRMMQAVSHHVEEEESDILPRLRSCCSGGELDRMGEQVELMKQHLSSGSSAPPASAASDGAGTTGRLIDLTKDELYEKAKQAGIEGRSSMNKKELAEALARH